MQVNGFGLTSKEVLYAVQYRKEIAEMYRTKQGQAEHDRKVLAIARELERQGFDVKADLPGYVQPLTIGGYRPDIVAQKGTQRKIVEVETQNTKGSTRDEGQKEAFRRAAEKNPNMTFRRVIADT